MFRPISITTSKVPRLFSPSDDAPKDEDGRSREEGTLEIVRRAVYGMLYADDAGVVSTSPRGLTSIMDLLVSCRMSGIRTDRIGERDRGHAPVVPSQHSVERPAN